MKILQISPSLINGGAERFVVDITNSLSLYGFDVTLLTLSSEEKDDLTTEVSSNVNLVRLNKKRI